MEERLRDWSAQIQRYILVRLGDRELAEEIAQEAVLRFLGELHAGKRIGQPRAWLFRTARNLAVDVVRRRLPSPLGLEALSMLPDPRSDLDEGEFDTRVGEVRRIEVLRWMPELIKTLPERDRLVLERRYAQGMSCQELARLQEISVPNAKIRLFRARRRLLAAIEQRLLAEGAGG